ncbi:MAG: type II secretion system F family protein [Patescibacteria group bacterium]|jgi:type IV pilus assembly protein PilC
MEYKYIATTTEGKIEEGNMEAATEHDVVSSLQNQNLYIISVHPKEHSLKSASRKVAGKMGIGGVSVLDRIIFARHLAVMLKAGLSLPEALDAIMEQTPSKNMALVVKNIIKDINNGSTLAASLARFPKVFSGMVVGMVQVGEASGSLEENLNYIATILDKDYQLRRKVKSAMMYPAIVLSGTFILGIGLSIFILPKLVRMFDTFRLELPVVTKIFLGLANFLVNYGLYVLVGLVGLIILTRFLMKYSLTKPFFHRIYLTLPIVGKLTKNVNLARLSRVMSILLKSGVTINESLLITEEVVTNVFFKRELEKSLEAVQRGKLLSATLAGGKYVPKMASRMIAEGEKTGNLEQSLAYLADFYEKEVDDTTKNLATILEPVLLIFIGVILGFLAVAIISPIYQFTGSLRTK